MAASWWSIGLKKVPVVHFFFLAGLYLNQNYKYLQPPHMAQLEEIDNLNLSLLRLPHFN